MNSESRRVLWLEDQVGTIKGTLRRLKRLGHTVDVCGTTSEAKDLVAARRYTHFIVDFQIPKDEMSESVKGEGLEFIDHLLPPLGEHNYRPEQILLLTAQSATLKRDFEFKKPIRCEVLAKPGSLKKIEQWIEAGI